jgi:hypothetical protein
MPKDLKGEEHRNPNLNIIKVKSSRRTNQIQNQQPGNNGIKL